MGSTSRRSGKIKVIGGRKSNPKRGRGRAIGSKNNINSESVNGGYGNFYVHSKK